jgi:Na+/proline symporter
MAETTNLDEVRGKALNRIDRSERNFKLGLIAFAVLEALVLIAILLGMERGNRLHWLLFIATGGFYTLICVGLFVLGLHVRRDTQLVLRAIETLGEQLKEDRR